MKLIQKIEKENKDVIKIMGIKFTRKKKIKAKKHNSISGYNKNRFYNMIVDKTMPESVKKGILENRFYNMVGYFPNLDTPKSFNEKLNWLKLYYKDPLMTKCVDKITFKDYIKETLGDGYTVPLIKVYNSPEEINFEELPNQFVIKSNCGWGGLQVCIVKDKNSVNIDNLKAQANNWILDWNNYFYQSFEWDCKDITPKIMVEEYIEQMDGQVYDYKFFCYNGEPKNLFVAADRFQNKSFNFYDLDWNLLPFTRLYPNSKYPLKKPKNFNKMVELARKLSKPFPFVRVDLYEIGDKVLVGELTFFPGGGVEPFTPVEWDYKLGEMLKLPEKKEI